MNGVRISSLYTAGSGAVRLVIGIVTAPLLVRMLGARTFGIFSVANSIIVLAMLAEFGISAAFTNELARDLANGDERSAGQSTATSLLIMTVGGMLSGTGIFVAAPMLSRWLFPEAVDQVQGLWTIRVLSCSLLARFWQLWANAAGAGLFRYDLQTAIELPSALAVQLGSILVAFFWRNAVAVASWQACVIFGTCIAHGAVLSRVWPRNARISTCSAASARRLCAFGFAQQANAIGSTLFFQADRIIVNGVLGPVATGLYAAATGLANKIVEIPYMFLRVLPSAATTAYALRDYPRLRYLFRQAVQTNGIITLLGASCVLFWAEPIASLMVGPKYSAEEVQVLQVLAVIYAFGSLCATAGSFGLGLGKPWILSRWSIIGGVLMCFTMRIAGARFGIMGAVWANAAFNVTALITAEIIPLLGIRMRDTVRAFAPFVFGTIACWAFCATSLYSQLPIAGKLLIFCVLEPLLFLATVGWSAIKDIAAKSLPVIHLAWAGKQQS